jgi:hypothetical protein
VLNHRWCNQNIHSKNNAPWSFLMSVMSSNVVRMRNV